MASYYDVELLPNKTFLSIPENMVHTSHCTTVLAAPSFRSRGKEGHGLKAVLRGVEGNMELMDSIRQLMVALDHALLELRQGQVQLIKFVHILTIKLSAFDAFFLSPMT